MNTDKECFLQYLPSVLWQEGATPPGFLERFLRIFQEEFDTLEKKVDDIPNMFDPWKTPAEFLPWLASWVALELDKGWTEQQSRALLRSIVSLYKKRGTTEGLQEYLKIYVGSNVTVEDLKPVEPFLHMFQITIISQNYNHGAQVELARQVRAIVDREKPAHTYYLLVIENPTMQIGKHSTIGYDTILGRTKH